MRSFLIGCLALPGLASLAGLAVALPAAGVVERPAARDTRFGASAPVPPPQVLELASHGRSGYQIVLPAEPIPSERYAAEELQHYLEAISGAKLPIVPDSVRRGSREILLGNNRHLEDGGPGFATLGTDGFALCTTARRVIIAGGRPRGTLNGVYTFLEEHLGVRWFTPELETVPRTNRLVLPMLNRTVLPRFDYREVFWTDLMRSGDFAARQRMNGQHCHLEAKHGGPEAVYYPFVHSFEELIPQSLYQDHPEYFPLINGNRVKGYVQRCLSNPEVVELAIKRVREWIREHPGATIISVSQNDTGNWCACDKCKAFDEAEGSPAASLIRFVNRIAGNIEKDYPAIRIDTLAYQYTRKPPRTLRPHRNVIIRLCSIECCFAHPLATCSSEQNRRFRDDILAWEPVAPVLYIWDYTPNFAHYQQPFPNFNAIQPNVRFFAAHNVRGLFEQGNYSPGGNGELGPLRAYLLAKLLWNPDTDLRRHELEFCKACYGPAAPCIVEYVDLLEQQVQPEARHAFIFEPPAAAYLNQEFIRQATAILECGFQAANTPETRARVRVAMLPIQYVQLATGMVAGEERDQMLTQFLQVARENGISHISEGQSLQEWARRMGQPFEQRSP